MLIAWIQDRLTVEETEALHAVRDDRLGPDPVPFGFLNHEWLHFKAMMQDGDEIWSFSSPPETWQNLAGREGVVLVRDGDIVHWIITKMN